MITDIRLFSIWYSRIESNISRQKCKLSPWSVGWPTKWPYTTPIKLSNDCLSCLFPKGAAFIRYHSYYLLRYEPMTVELSDPKHPLIQVLPKHKLLTDICGSSIDHLCQLSGSFIRTLSVIFNWHFLLLSNIGLVGEKTLEWIKI